MLKTIFGQIKQPSAKADGCLMLIHIGGLPHKKGCPI
jgi:hypothetical protein